MMDKLKLWYSIKKNWRNKNKKEFRKLNTEA